MANPRVRTDPVAAELARVSACPMFTARRTGTVTLDGERVHIVAGRTRIAADILQRNASAVAAFDVGAFAPSLHAMSTRRRRTPGARRRARTAPAAAPASAPAARPTGARPKTQTLAAARTPTAARLPRLGDL